MPATPRAVLPRRAPPWLPYLAGSAVLVLVVLTLVAVALRHDAAWRRDRAISHTQSVARLLALHVADTLDQTDVVLHSLSLHLAEADEPEPHSPRALRADLARALALSREIEALQVLDANGQVRASTAVAADASPPAASPDTLDDLRQLRQQPGDGLHISPPRLNRVSGQWTLQLARRLEDSQGDFTGIVVADIATGTLDRLFASLDVGPSGVIALRGEDLSLIARHPPSSAPALAVGSRAVTPLMREQLGGHATQGLFHVARSLDDLARDFAFHRTGRHPLVVLVGRPSDDQLAAPHGGTQWLLLLGSLAAIAAPLGAWALYRVSQRQARQRGEQDAARMLESAPVAMLLVDPAGQITRANPAAGRLLGASIGEIVGSPVERFVPDAVRAGHASLREDYLRMARSNGQDHMVDVQVQRPDGERLPARVSVAPVQLDGGLRLVVTLDDHRERLRWETERAARQALQAALQEHTPVAVIATDLRGLIAGFNPAAEALFGYRAEELVGRHTPARLHDAHALRLRASPDTWAESPGTVPGDADVQCDEVPMVHRNGQHFTARRTVVVLRDGTGRAVGRLFLFQDQRAEREAAATLVRLALTAAAGGVGLWEWTPGRERAHWDDRLCDRYGIPQGLRALGVPLGLWRARLHPADVRRVTATLERAARTGAAGQLACRMLRPDGSLDQVELRWLVESAADGQARHLSGTHRVLRSDPHPTA